MRVAVDIGVLVVLAMVGDPVDDAALDGEAAGEGEDGAHGASRRERLVGEQAVIADGDSVHPDDVQHRQHHEVEHRHPADDCCDRCRDDDRDERDADEDAEDGALQAAGGLRDSGGAGVDGGGWGSLRGKGLGALHVSDGVAFRGR